jgi:hypothetical protein
MLDIVVGMGMNRDTAQAHWVWKEMDRGTERVQVRLA